MKMFSENLVKLRKLKNLTQEDIAAKIGVTRQSVAKWEAGETIPDIDRCKLLAELFEELPEVGDPEKPKLRKESISSEW